MMLFLSRSDPLVSEFPPFILDVREVVDSSTESLSVCTQNEQDLKAPVQNRKKWALRFQELDYPVSSGPMTVRGIIRRRQGASPLTKRRLDGGEA
jgi:hypothetical protein